MVKKLFILYLIFFLPGCGKDIQEKEGKVEISRVIEYTSLSITNNTKSTVNFSGWKLTEEISFFTTTTKDYLFQSVSLAAGGTISFTASQLGFRLQKPDEMLYLYDQSGRLVDQMSWVSFE
jgi:hypothetical protein